MVYQYCRVSSGASIRCPSIGQTANSVKTETTTLQLRDLWPEWHLRWVGAAWTVRLLLPFIPARKPWARWLATLYTKWPLCPAASPMRFPALGCRGAPCLRYAYLLLLHHIPDKHAMPNARAAPQIRKWHVCNPCVLHVCACACAHGHVCVCKTSAKCTFSLPFGNIRSHRITSGVWSMWRQSPRTTDPSTSTASSCSTTAVGGDGAGAIAGDTTVTGSPSTPSPRMGVYTTFKHLRIAQERADASSLPHEAALQSQKGEGVEDDEELCLLVTQPETNDWSNLARTHRSRSLFSLPAPTPWLQATLWNALIYPRPPLVFAHSRTIAQGVQLWA